MNSLTMYFQGDKLGPFIDLLAFVTILLLFRSAVSSLILKRVIDLVTVGLASVITTVYVLKGIMYSDAISFVQDVIILILALILLFEQIRTKEIYIFQHAEFWIAVGSIVYYFMACFSSLIVEFTQASDMHHDRLVLLLVVQIIQFGFYLFSAAIPKNFPGRNSERKI